MNKDFNNWSIFKENLHLNKKPLHCSPRQIWWCSLGVNIGSEQDGTGSNYDRPFLVIKSFNSNTFWGVALTGHKRQGKYYFYLGKIVDQEASIILSQIRLLDTKRLIEKIAVIPEPVFEEIKKALQGALF
jgi:mRNA-degrading endonuclease toxin of MazEF toxin-antitoxin module